MAKKTIRKYVFNVSLVPIECFKNFLSAFNIDITVTGEFALYDFIKEKYKFHKLVSINSKTILNQA